MLIRHFCTLTRETQRAIRTRAGYNHIEKSMTSASPTSIKVLRLRLKDKHAKFLSGLAREANFVWNYCNDLQITMFNRERRFLSGFDFAKFTRGATKEGLHLHSQTVQAIAEEYATRRRQFKKVRLSRRDVGIDLGLTDLIATSAGEKVSAPQFHRGLE